MARKSVQRQADSPRPLPANVIDLAQWRANSAAQTAEREHVRSLVTEGEDAADDRATMKHELDDAEATLE